MSLVFTRINDAIHFTKEYYYPDRIKDYLLWFARGEYEGTYLHKWDEFVLKVHQYMEDEILQTVFTANNITKVLMFEELRRWITEDWRFKDVNENYFWKWAIEHNDKLHEDLKISVAEQETTFLANPNLKKYGQNEEYEIEVKNYFAMLMPGSSLLNYKRKVFNRWFYCIEDTPEYIEYFFIPKYIAMVRKVVNSFKSIVNRHLALHDAGKYQTAHEITITQAANFEIEQPKLLHQLPESEPKKLQANLTGEQLLYLFKKFFELGIIEPESQKEVCEFISNNFYANSKGKSQTNISADRLTKIWNTLDAKIAGDWKDKFIALMNEAIKDNPLNLKGNK